MLSIAHVVAHSIVFLLTVKCYLGVCGSVIKNLDVPLIVRNGTGPVDLSCIYEVDGNENGLVIKWFHEAYQIYQWIPPIPPQDVGIIKGFTEYPAEMLEDPYSRSVIRLKNVTIDMGGEYTCAISTYQDEASISTKMIIYVPENDMIIRTYPFNETHVNLTCTVTGAYPRPILKLYIEGNESDNHDDYRKSSFDWYRENLHVSLNVIIQHTLDPAIVECEMAIPETEYKPQLLSYRANNSPKKHCAILLVDILFVIIFRVILT